MLYQSESSNFIGNWQRGASMQVTFVPTVGADANLMTLWLKQMVHTARIVHGGSLLLPRSSSDFSTIPKPISLQYNPCSVPGKDRLFTLP